MSQPLNFFYIIFCFKKILQNKIILVHYPNPLAFLILLFFFNKKIIIFWHSDILNKGIILNLFSYIEKIIIKRSSRIIVTSKDYLYSSKPLSKFKHKTEVISLTIKEDFKYKKPSVDQKILSKKYILSVGRLVKYKGFQYLVRSMRHLPKNINLILVGDGPELQKLKENINTKNLKKRIIILTRVSETEKNWLIKNCYIFCLPSVNRSEAFGVSLLEALAHGKPLITSKIKGSGMNSINVEKITGFFSKPMSPRSISNTILKLHKIKNKNNFINNCKFRYKNFFSQEIFVKKIIKLFQSI